MANELATLVVKLEAQTAQYQANLEKAQRQLAGFQKSVNHVTDTVKNFGRGLIAGLTVGAVVGGIKHLISVIDDLDEAAQAVGTNAVSLSNLQQAFAEGGVGAEKLQIGLTKLSVKLADAASGNIEAASLFKAMGVAIKDVDGHVRNSSVVMGDLAAMFSRMQDGAAKTALAVELFGKSGAAMIPVLNQGSENLKRFSGLTEETVKQATKLQAEFDKLGATSDRLKFSFLGWLIPKLNEALEVSRGINKELTNPTSYVDLSTGATIITEAGHKQAELNALIQLGTEHYGREGRAAQLFAEDALNNAVKIAAAEKARIAAAEKAKRDGEAAFKAGQDFLKNLNDRVTKEQQNEFAVMRTEAAQRRVLAAAEPLIAVLEREKNLRESIALYIEQAKDEEKRQDASNEFMAAMNDRIRGYEDEAAAISMTDAEQRKLAAAREIDATAAARVSALTGENISAQADAVYRQADAAKLAANNTIEFLDAQTRARAIVQSVTTPLEVYELQMANLAELLAKGALNQEYFNRAAKQAKEVLDANNGTLVAFASGLQGIISDALTGGFEDGAKGILRAFIALLLRMQAEAIAAKIAKAIIDLGATSGGGNIWSTVLGAAVTAAGSGSTGRNDMRAGRSYIVGERGPERFVPEMNGKLLSNEQMAPTVNVNPQIINVRDPNEIPAALQGGAGEKAIINVIGRNPSVIRQLLQG